jgi:hypothetical protein
MVQFGRLLPLRIYAAYLPSVGTTNKYEEKEKPEYQWQQAGVGEGDLRKSIC